MEHQSNSLMIILVIPEVPTRREELIALCEDICTILQRRLGAQVQIQERSLAPESAIGLPPTSPPPVPIPARSPLTEREKEVLYWRLEGLSRKETADQMFVTEEWVKKITASILGKPPFQEMRQAWEAANLARDKGWIPPRGTYTRRQTITPASHDNPPKAPGAPSTAKGTQTAPGTAPLSGPEPDPTLP